MRAVAVAALMLSLFISTYALAEDDRLRPYVLAESSAGTIADKLESVTSSLKSEGFTVAGEYAPYAGAHILVITNDSLRKQAAQSDFGGYGSAVRVSLTEMGGEVQVSYTNPGWMGNVYRMSGDMGAVTAGLKKALGWSKDYGSSGGRTVKNLREYHYMMFMPYFDDHVELASYDSQQAAVDAVEAGLAAGKGGTQKIYRIDVDGKEESLFGVAIKEGKGADQPIMEVIDQADPRHTAHLPYEVLVSGGKVYMLHGKFRIAQSFPDLTMGTFMKISDAPDAIEETMKTAVSK